MITAVRPLLITVLALWPWAAGAQILTATGGEHDGFTRIVVQGAAIADWSLTGSGRRRVLSVPDAADGIDIRRLFDRIARNRVADARSDPGALTIELACDCAPRAWLLRPGVLVIDIADPAPGDDTAAPQVEAPLARLPPPAPHLPTPAALRAAGAAVARQLVPPPEPAPEPALRAHLLDALGRTLADGAAQGLLAPVETPVSQPAVVLPATSTQVGGGLDHIAIETAQVTQAAEPDTGPDASFCAAARVLDPILNDSDRGFSARFAAIVQELYGEFDTPSPEAQRRLVTLYLASGFGAEAAVILDTLDDAMDGRAFLRGLSDIFEGRSSNSRHQLAQAIGCGGAAALFAALAGAEGDRIVAAADAIALTFSTAPANLRAIIGDDLAKVLIDAGAIDAARAVAEALRRGGLTPPEALAVLDARLEHARGYAHEALALINTDAEDTAATHLARLEWALETGAELPPAYEDHVEALAATLRSAPEGQDLMQALIRQATRRGDFAGALARVDRLTRWRGAAALNDPELAGLTDLVWAVAAQNTDDPAFLHLVLGREDWRSPARDATTRRALAVRFLELGLPEAARDLLRPEEGAMDVESAQLQAGIALAAGRPAEALDHLPPVHTTDHDHAPALAGSGMQPPAHGHAESTEAAHAHADPQTSGPGEAHDATSPAPPPMMTETRRLRAQAHAALGDTARAAEEFAAIEDIGPALHNAIAAERWPMVAALAQAGPDAAPNPLAGAAAALGLRPGETAGAEAPRPDRMDLVQRGSVLLEQSAALRAALAPLIATQSGAGPNSLATGDRSARP
ncbi:MAG: hypothetical protein R3D60_02290 [Paracoccaceae bacterium]